MDLPVTSVRSFVSFDERPAVTGTTADGGLAAFVIPAPGGAWRLVDLGAVDSEAGVLSEAAWRERFKTWFTSSKPAA